MVAGAGIHIKQPLDVATNSFREHLHTWPGLTVEQGEDKIIVRMEQKLSIYVHRMWLGWPVEVIMTTP